MKSLNLTQDRGFHEIEILEENNTTRKLRIPKELTVAQVERILDLQSQAESIASQEIKEDGLKQADEFWQKVFIMLEIMFKVYQPEIDVEYLKKHLTTQDALAIAGFFNNNRFLQLAEVDSDPKKKVLNQENNS